MAAVTTELKVLVKAVGKGEIDKLSKALNDLGSKAAQPVNQKLKSSVSELKKLSSQSVTTKNNLKGFSAAFRELANNLEVGSKEFKEATAEAARLDAQLKKLETRKAPTMGQRLRRGAQTAGAVAAGGVFGGPEGAIGALIGSAGGPAGAAVGAAIGAQVGQVRQALGETAKYSANLAKLRIALKGVTTSQGEYGEALDFIQESTKRFAIPQEIVTKQFTKLQASVQGAGGGIEDTKTAFNGIVASVRATGGSLQDIDSALTATAQVFSKGKVSAEELRQQIGERLPGAFSLFAKSLGITPQELDKALEDGKVSLQDFQTFAEEIFKKYGLTAEIIASSPEAAGDRLNVALSNASESVGRLLQPIGEAFQRVFTAIVEQIDRAARALDRFLGISDDSRIDVLNKQIQESNDKLLSLQRDLKAAKQADTGSDLLGGADAFGQGPGAVRGAGGGVAAIQAQIAEVERDRAQIEQELGNLNALRALRGDVEQAKPGTGLPGIDLDTSTNNKIKEISANRLKIEQQLLDAKEAGDKLKVAELTRDARLAEIAEQKLGPNLRLLEQDKARTQFALTKQRLDEQEEKRLQRIAQANASLNQKYDEARLKLGEITEEQKLQLDAERLRTQLIDTMKKALGEAAVLSDAVKEKIDKIVEAFTKTTNRAEDLKKAFKDKVKNVLDLENNIRERLQGAVFELGDTFADFVTTGKASFADFTRSVLNDLAKILARFAVMQTLKAFIPGGSALGAFLGFADGGVIAKNKVVPFAYGGVVNKPTLFPMANGAGLMGEAGPEAIMPLRRNSSGRLGVEASGSGATTVNVSVDASGSQVQGDSAQAAQLGKAIGVAVQTEILKQKRPGGLLATT